VARQALFEEKGERHHKGKFEKEKGKELNKVGRKRSYDVGSREPHSYRETKPTNVKNGPRNQCDDDEDFLLFSHSEASKVEDGEEAQSQNSNQAPAPPNLSTNRKSGERGAPPASRRYDTSRRYATSRRYDTSRRCDKRNVLSSSSKVVRWVLRSMGPTRSELEILQNKRDRKRRVQERRSKTRKLRKRSSRGQPIMRNLVGNMLTKLQSKD